MLHNFINTRIFLHLVTVLITYMYIYVLKYMCA